MVENYMHTDQMIYAQWLITLYALIKWSMRNG